MAKQADISPWRTLEEEVYHAFREWPIWLALRERELAVHLRPADTTDAAESQGTRNVSTSGLPLATPHHP